MRLASNTSTLVRHVVNLHPLATDLARDIDDVLMMCEIDCLSTPPDPIENTKGATGSVLARVIGLADRYASAPVASAISRSIRPEVVNLWTHNINAQHRRSVYSGDEHLGQQVNQAVSCQRSCPWNIAITADAI